jgi:8-oxo-dGTP pyrophosphatase MutT (NUDIX family)
MTKEFSAGGIVYKTTNNQQATSNNLVWLVCQHSQHKGWVFPKGLIGDHKAGETSEETALREVQEETGVLGRIIEKVKDPATYFYMWQGDKRFKTVYYFLMEYISGDINNHDNEMSDVEWLPEKEVFLRLSYKSDKIAFEEALELMKKSGS